MKNRNVFIHIAGVINLLTACIHTFLGQMDLVSPLLESNLTQQAQTEWLGVWHMATVFLFATSFYLLKKGTNKLEINNLEVLSAIGVFYILISVPFIVSSIFMNALAPQWILLLPIGTLTLIGLKKENKLLINNKL